MTDKIRYSNLIPFVAILVWSFCSTLSAQQFRQPNIPPDPGSMSGETDAGPLPGKAVQENQNRTDNFVPNSSKESLGFVPVRPKSGSLNDDDAQILGSRTMEQERILEKIRDGNFGEQSEGVERQQGPQIIRKRYDNGKDHLVRQVLQDEQGNFYNHGPWQLFNRRGDLMASGQFVDGLMDGTWERWHTAKSGGMFATKPFTEFEGPYVSTATFSNGKLHGVWVISDRYRRKIVEVPYQNGKRHGSATWWYPSSERMRVITFNEGTLDGPMYEWDDKNKLVRNDEFINGQKVIRQVTLYRPKQRSSESYYLEAELSLETDDNWWDAEPAQYVQLGSRVQHGPTFAWHNNGQRKMAGQYKNDTRVGQFTWWHENGQKSLMGRYDENGTKVGLWTWWHENGMKSIQGSYDEDNAIGEWIWWDKNGQVRDRDDLGQSPESSGELIQPQEDNSEDPNAENETVEQEDQVKSGVGDPPKQGIEEMEEISPLNIDENDSKEENPSDSEINL